jgi:phosphoribosyl 1,2-cyclic phosphodiesterase
MLAVSLQSGSNGNCIYVEAKDVRLLIDAGIPGSAAESRLKQRGRDIRDVDAVIISHDHADHIRHAGVLQRKFDIPVYVSVATLDTAMKRVPLGKLKDIEHFKPGATIDFGSVKVDTIPTHHDAADGASFVIRENGTRLGVFTDVGHVFDGLDEAVSSLDAVFIESNYDPKMLEHGRYPAHLKKRISGPYGHISNFEAAELISSHGVRLKWACLAHLSENNNTPALALRTCRSVVGDNLPLYLASRWGPTEVLSI